MRCPKCGATTRTVDSRERRQVRYRRRECVACGYRFTTVEQIQDDSGHSMGAAGLVERCRGVCKKCPIGRYLKCVTVRNQELKVMHGKMEV